MKELPSFNAAAKLVYLSGIIAKIGLNSIILIADLIFFCFKIFGLR